MLTQKKKSNNFVKLDTKKDTRVVWFKKKWVLWMGLIMLFIIIFFGILFLVYKEPATIVYEQGISGKDAFLDAQENLIAQDFEAASHPLDSAIKCFNTAHDEFQSFKWLSTIPWLGSQITAVDNLLAAGIATGVSVEQINDLAIDIVTPLQRNDDIGLSSLSEEETVKLLKSIAEGKPFLEKSKKSIDEAVNYIDQIPDRGLINKIKEVTDPLKEQVPALQDAIDKAISASQIIPAIAGYPEEKTYLFLLQNNTEMRPSGGFIGTYGILKVKNGDIIHFETDNSYNLDKPAEAYLSVEPPWPLTRYNAVYSWFFRDSNWSPDFPTTAEKAEWFYHQERGSEQNIDGIVAVTPTFIQSLLSLTGDIKINGLTFTEDNLVETLQYQVEKGFLRKGLEESERKEIIGVLSSMILDKVLELPKSKWPDLWKVFTQDIVEKQILLYVKDEYVQNFILKENWGGAIQNTDYDYLSVIDANLASLKSDPVVKRTIEYQVRRDGSNFIADVRLTYKNEGSITWKTTRYRTYTRIYVPQGAVLLTSSGSMVDCKLTEEGSVETTEENNKTVFGTFICIEPDEEKTLTFKYKLPDFINEVFEADTYQLLVQKQAGAEAHNLKINIDLGKNHSMISDIDNINVKLDNGILITTELSSDLNFTIDY